MTDIIIRNAIEAWMMILIYTNSPGVKWAHWIQPSELRLPNMAYSGGSRAHMAVFTEQVLFQTNKSSVLVFNSSIPSVPLFVQNEESNQHRALVNWFTIHSGLLSMAAHMITSFSANRYLAPQVQRNCTGSSYQSTSLNSEVTSLEVFWSIPTWKFLSLCTITQGMLMYPREKF